MDGIVPRPLELPIALSSTFELCPLRVAPDRDEFLVGGVGARSYVALTSVALEATRLLSDRVPVGRVKALLADKYSVVSVCMAPLLQELVHAGLVWTIDGTPVGERPRSRPVRRPLLTSGRVAPLFGQRAGLVYVLILAGAIAAIVSDPRCLPHARLLIADRSYGMLWLSLAAMAALAVKHECAHVAAARRIGVGARWRLGHRLCFPVVETDLSDLWLVASRERYLVYVAGVASDILAAALALIGTWAHLHGWVVLPPLLYRALELTVLIGAVVAIWQCNVFLRTDGYYVLANALGCRNLAGDAKAYLRSRLPWSVAAADGSAYPRIVRLYAAGYAVTAVVLGALWVLGLGLAVRGAGGGSRATAVSLTISAALLATGIVAEQRRAQRRYRLVFPPGL